MSEKKSTKRKKGLIIKQAEIATLLFLAFFLIVSVQAQSGVRFDIEKLRQNNIHYPIAYEIIKSEQAWDAILKSGSRLHPVIVGIADSGVKPDHKEFNSPPVNFVGTNDRTMLYDHNAPEGHGTAIAGIIGANNAIRSDQTLNDSVQMNGILSGALQEYQYGLDEQFIQLTGSRKVTDELIFAAIKLLGLRGANIINMSIEGYLCSAVPVDLREVYNGECYETINEFNDIKKTYSEIFNSYALTTLFVSAAGNAGVSDVNSLPAGVKLPNVLSVAGTRTDLSEQRVVAFPEDPRKSSNFNSDIAAPAVNIYAPIPGPPENAYLPDFEGTSFSAPLVTGVAGLLKSIRPELEPKDLKEILVNTSDIIQTGEPSKRLGTGCYPNANDTVNTGCRLNAERAVTATLPSFIYLLDAFSVNGNISPISGCSPAGTSFFDPFDDGAITTGCTASFGFFGHPIEQGGFLTFASSFAERPADNTDFLIHNAVFQHTFFDGNGNFDITANFAQITPTFSSGYGMFLIEDGGGANLPFASIQVGSINGRFFLNATQNTPTFTARSVPVFPMADHIVLKFSFNDSTNLVTPSYSLDNGGTFIVFKNQDNSIYTIPFFGQAGNAFVQLFASLRDPQSVGQSQLLSPLSSGALQQLPLARPVINQELVPKK